MRNASALLSSYASDTSGVSSALYELGGMTVVHDASGCNSTYSTFDEPRWYDHESMVFISALTEMDAVFGQDDRFVANCVRTAKALRPNFIALASSPVPHLLGCDLAALARQIEERTSIPTFAIPTNGMDSYVLGASKAFAALTARFAKNAPKTAKPSVNILGLTPLDFGLGTLAESLRHWLEAEGYALNGTLAMGTRDSLAVFSTLSAAHVSLVVSGSGLAAARELSARFAIPYVTGVPFGSFGKTLAHRLNDALTHRRSYDLTLPAELADGASTCIIGESVFAASLAHALADEGFPSRVLIPTEKEAVLVEAPHCAGIEDESLTETFVQGARHIVADPFYRPIIPEGAFLHTYPHVAFSGRIYARAIPDLIQHSPAAWFKEQAC